MSHTPSIVDHARVTVMTFTSPPSLPLQSGRLSAAHRNNRRCKPEKPVRTPGGSGRLGCSRLSHRPLIAPGSPRPTSVPDDSPAHVCRKTSDPLDHPPSAVIRRLSLRFAQRQRHVRQQDASRDCQEWCVSLDVPHWTMSAGTIPPRNALSTWTSCKCVYVCVYAWACAGMCVCARV
jgi:hypothetical protein